jgi:hypothetical protein
MPPNTPPPMPDPTDLLRRLRILRQQIRAREDEADATASAAELLAEMARATGEHFRVRAVLHMRSGAARRPEQQASDPQHLDWGCWGCLSSPRVLPL